MVILVIGALKTMTSREPSAEPLPGFRYHVTVYSFHNVFKVLTLHPWSCVTSTAHLLHFSSQDVRYLLFTRVMSSSEDGIPNDDDDETSDFYQSPNRGGESSPPVSDETKSNLSRGRSNIKQSTRKRKANSDSHSKSKSRVKRLKPLYNDEYRQLYNDTIHQLNSKLDPKNLRNLTASQIGVSIWSVEEKANFFFALQTYGRHNARSIAAAIQTKSESEVRVYLDLLHKSAIEREFRTIHPKQMFNVCNTEGAIEVTPSCESALEAAADALSLLQHRQEKKIARLENPEFWLLTPSIAKWADRNFKAGGDAGREILKKLPSAELLDPKTLLRLSKRFFMNSNDPSGNWRTYVDGRGTPSLIHSAFSDFHALAVNFTNRVIQSAISLADSRIRAETTEYFTPQHHVRREDVLSALDILGSRHDSHATWINMPRKFTLRVYDDSRHKKGREKEFFNYDYLEKQLAESDNSRGKYRSQTQSRSRGRSREKSNSSVASSAPSSNEAFETDAAEDSRSVSSGSCSGQYSNGSRSDSAEGQGSESNPEEEEE